MLRSFGSGRRHGAHVGGVHASPMVPDARPAVARPRGTSGSEVLKIIVGLAIALAISLVIRSLNNGLDHPYWHL